MLKQFLSLIILSCVISVYAQQSLNLPHYEVVAQKRQVVIDWSYWCGGSDIAYFVVERSKDTKNVDSLAQYPLICLTSGELTPYTFADSMPEVGLSYYRIKAYSHIYNTYYYETWQKVVFKGNENIFFEANPNPMEDEMRLIWYKSMYGNVKVILYDSYGNIVRNLVNENINAGTSVITIKENIATLPSGLYYLQAEIGENSFQTKLVKK